MTLKLTGTAVVTGGASGIGRALAQQLAAAGARTVVVVDRDEAGARKVAAALPAGATGIGTGLDVTQGDRVRDLVDRLERESGPLEVWCSNAGVALGDGLGEDSDWERSWQLHVLAHVHTARALLPRMAARGHGYFLVTASAAGLLTEVNSAPYSVTKHASVALAEWLAIEHGDSGVHVSCLCPQAVRTPLLEATGPNSAAKAAGAMLEPEQVAEATLAAMAENRFLVLPHPEVADYERRRAGDRDRWLAGMRKVRARLRPAAP